MNKEIETRRRFLQNAVTACLGIPILLGCKGNMLAESFEEEILTLIKRNAIQNPNGEWSGAIGAPADVSWRTVLATAKDEGEPMLISGTVYQKDGKTAAPNTLIYFYHTDVHGIYGRDGQPRHGRYRGWMLTDAKGRYEFRSIKPASYPNAAFAAHVHMTVTTTEKREDWIDSILFEGDRFISAREREMAGRKGGFQPIVRLEKDAAGIARAVRDIRL